MRPYTHVEPRTQVSDAALASGDLSAWKQVLGFADPDPKVPGEGTPTPPADPNNLNPTPGDFVDDEADEDGLEVEDDDEDSDDE